MKKSSRNKWISFVISAGGAMALSQMLLQEGRGLGYTNSFLPVLVLALSLPVIHKGLWELKVLAKKPAWTILLASAFVFCCEVGSRLEISGYLPLNDWKMWTAFPFAAVFFAVLLGCFWNMLETKGVGGSGKPLSTAWKQRLGAAAFLLLFWSIVLLAVWPGFFVYDAWDEFIQVQNGEFTMHHPLPHVLLLGGIITAGYEIFGNYNEGIVCYMVFQMLIMAFCFTYIWDYLRKKAAPSWLTVGSLLYFALFPVIQMYVLCSAKDTLYSAGVMLVILLLLEAVELGRAFWGRNVRTFLLLGSLCVMGVMRNNGLYILILMIPVMTLMPGRKDRRAGGIAALSGVTALVLCLLLTGGLKTALNASDNENQEMLTVPIQQLVRTWKLEPELFSEEEEQILFSYIPEDVAAVYSPKISDVVKAHFSNETYSENPSGFWKLWASIGLRSPMSYLNAWMMTSYGFWYPEAVIDIYGGNQVYTFTYGESSYFGFETEPPGTRDSKIPWLEEVFRRMSLEIFQQKMPVTAMLFSPGFLFWVYAVGIGYLVYRGRYRAAGAFLPAILNWLTVLLGPTYVVRYVVIWWFALPILLYAVVNVDKLCYTDMKTLN